MLRNFATAVILTAWISGYSQEPVYLDYNAPIDDRVEDALHRMTLEEKVKVLHAQSKFSSAGVPRLGIPDLWCTDGPHGVRPEVYWDEWNSAEWTNDSCTAFPALTCLAATWNPALALEYGRAIGEEARYRRKDVLLGPGVNIMRTPLCGRSFEYMGEDPFLTSSMAGPYIQGVQSNNVSACVKHLALNNNEDNRYTSNVHVSERALREIYLAPFKAAIDAGAWAMMPAYNLFEDRHCCENPRLIRDILKSEWGFDGVAISDWGGVHNTDDVIEGGLDIEMGTGTDGVSVNMNAYDNYYMANPYLEKLRNGQASVADLDDRVRRVLRTIFRTSMAPSHWKGRFTCPEHYLTARKIGAEGIVLLKNNGILPLGEDIKRVLVVGENAVKMMTVGGGSASLKVQHEISPLTGLISALKDVDVDWERGYIGAGSTEFDNVRSRDAEWLDEDRTPMQLRADVLSKAKKADIVIFIGGLNHSHCQDTENSDRKTLQLPYGQDE
ncbi:MAG: glycoside hydrolase family 3 C-terminal domain-containing protein, partial [Muribaculaceae bacterium]|nr:glycoside hydrolase family 3 C-terminal domain-containing protein [Muribaculaceae bacterium]